MNMLDEYMWAGYLKWALETGELTADDDIARAKREFYAGLHGEDA